MVKSRKVRIDYKKELEEVAKSMIFIHNPDALIKIIMRRLVKMLDLEHAGVLLQERNNGIYVLTTSSGRGEFRLPPGFLSLKKDSPVIKFFTIRNGLRRVRRVLARRDVLKVLRSSRVKNDSALKEFFLQLKEQLDIYKAELCIPSFFRNQLIGVILLGRKKNGENFGEKDIGFLHALASDVSMSVINSRLFEELLRQVEFNRHLFYNTVSALAQAIEAKDRYTRGHTQRVTEISLRIARRLLRDARRKFHPQFLENVKVASLLHDIGKIGIPEEILNKKGRLNSREWEIIRRHPIIGADILAPIKELGAVRSAILSHHERYDGKGYPQGLSRGKIPIIASVIGCADAFDAMTSDRPYRKKFTVQKALRELEKERAKQFHPYIVDILVNLILSGSI